jgi:hypothetical protein
MRAKLLLGLLAFAMPVSGQTPAFEVLVNCDGPVPLGIRIVAKRPASAYLPIADLLDYCMRDHVQQENSRIKQ